MANHLLVTKVIIYLFARSRIFQDLFSILGDNRKVIFGLFSLFGKMERTYFGKTDILDIIDISWRRLKMDFRDSWKYLHYLKYLED